MKEKAQFKYDKISTLKINNNHKMNIRSKMNNNVCSCKTPV